jgi:hypothetical protein
VVETREHHAIVCSAIFLQVASMKGNVLARVTALVLVAGAVVIYECSQAKVEAVNSLYADRATLLLEVRNTHFTVGRKVRSAYLRVLSDGSVECHTEKYWHEQDVVKRGMLSPEDLEALNRLLNDPNLLDVKPRYKRMHLIVDSWMEWDIKIPHHRHTQRINIAGFSPTAAKKRNEPYPTVLAKLGCSIWKVRNDVYGDEKSSRASREEACQDLLGAEGKESSGIQN